MVEVGGFGGFAWVCICVYTGLVSGCFRGHVLGRGVWMKPVGGWGDSLVVW